MRASLCSRNFLTVAAITALLCIGAQAQEKQDFSKSVSAFPNVIAPYGPRHVEPPSFTNSDRTNQLLKDGKLMLSLNDAVAMALENNLDLVIARYNLPIADTDVLRTRAGQSTRGVNTGLVQGTPGGGVGAIGSTGAQGGGAGGTQASAGGAGTGASGLVTSTLGVGPSVDNFDPVLTSSLGIEHATTPQSNIVFTGVPSLQQNSGSVNFGYQQGFPTGTLFSVAFNNSRVTSNSTRTFLVPQLNASYRLQLRQHLLQGWGIQSNKRFIIQARNNREIADVSFRQQVIATVGQIENIYWNLVSAHQDVQAKQRALDLAKRLQADNEKQVQIGTLAPIEVVSAESAVAARNQDLIISQTNLQLQQLLMKNAVTRNQNDPVLAAAEVVPTDTMALPTAEPVTPVQDLIADALQRRPELAQSRIDLTNREISKRAARNSLLPSLDAVAFYGGSALAGSLNPGFVGAPPGTVNTGYGDAFTNLGTYPDYFIGLNLNIPIRNRGAQADQVRSELEFRQAQVRLQQLQNQIGIEVRNAQFSVLQNRARIDAAQKGRDFAAQSLDAEQKKYALGASTTYNVLQAMNNLAAAESSVVAAMTAYEQSRVQLDQVTGRTLDSLGIDISDAENGTVTRTPNVPGVLPASQVNGQPLPGAATTPQATPQPSGSKSTAPQPPAAPKQ